MLRSTNRLAKYLAAAGRSLYHHEGRSCEDFILSSLQEAEFVPEASCSDTGCTASNKEPSPIPWTNRDFRVLWALTDEHDYFHGHEIIPFQEEIDRLRVLERKSGATIRPSGGSVDILWISDTEFVTCQIITGWHGLDRARIYSYKMLVTGKYSRVPDFQARAFSLSRFDGTGTRTAGPPPDLPIMQLSRELMPVLKHYRRIDVEFHEHPRTEAALSLVPTVTERLSKGITIKFVNPSTDIIRGLASRLVNRHVLLSLEVTRNALLSPEAMNNLLLAFRQPLHLQIPKQLLEFESDEESFASNPAFTALTIPTDLHGQVSNWLLDGLSKNQGVTQLTIGLPFWYDADEHHWIINLFDCAVLQSSSNLECLTFLWQTTPTGIKESLTNWPTDLRCVKQTPRIPYQSSLCSVVHP
jgi:hypothetical protein